jgi:ribokinase
MGGVVLVAGSANLDFVVRAAHVPAPGETVLGQDFATYPGGKGANQAVAAARAGGATTRMLLALGQDAPAQVLESSLREAGVACEIIRSDSLPTGVAFICVSDAGENAITVAPGANAALRPEHLPSLHGIDCLLLQLETPLDSVTAWARSARRAGVRVVLNAAPARALASDLLTQVDVLIVNEGELASICGHAGSIAARLAALDIGCVVVTLGALGCCAFERGAWRLQLGFRVDALDTTAAGDTFCGALAAALARGDALSSALPHACAAAALACTRRGAQSSIPTRRQVEALLAACAEADSGDYARLASHCGLIHDAGSPPRLPPP